MSHQVIEAQRLTIYCTESARHGGKPLFEWLVTLAMQQKMRGATALRGVVGFGRHRHIHHAHFVELAGDLPVVVELIDTAARIDAYLEAAGASLDGYTFVREDVRWHQPTV